MSLRRSTSSRKRFTDGQDQRVSRMMKSGGKRGEITVFLSMILLCSAGLICVMLESARTAGARCYLQTAANSSIDSLFSEYHRQLWQSYHLLGLEYRTQEDIKDRYIEFLNVYLETENWYPMITDSVAVENMQCLTDGGGIWLEDEILGYMKYGIWDSLDIVPEDGERLWDVIKEAGAMKDLSSSYGAESREAWKLEQALDKIYECINRQRDLKEQGAGALSGENGSRFFREAAALKDEIKKLPGLVKSYEKQVDKMKGKLAEMEHMLAERGTDLTDEMRRTMEQELEPCHSYIEETGVRRQEILNLVPAGEQNLSLIEDVISRVNDIVDYISSLDDEDEDNSGSMWSAARSGWSQIHISGFKQKGLKDEEKKGWLEKIGNMVSLNLLELVIPPDRELSTVILDLADAPSKDRKITGETDRKNPVKRVLANEYCAMHFSNFRWAEKKGDTDGPLKQQYEMEYLLTGGENDRDNLADTVKKLLMVREGMNVIHILSDSHKREEARALALVLTGALGLTPLVEIMTYFVISIWALGESVGDIQGLLEGRKIPLLKAKEDWTLGIEQLLAMGQEKGNPISKESERGLDYEGYLKLLLLLENSEQKYFRMMDIMQMNIRLEQVGFLMKNCGYRVDMKVGVGGKHVFFALPFVENLTGSREHGYQMTVRTEKAY